MGVTHCVRGMRLMLSQQRILFCSRFIPSGSVVAEKELGRVVGN